MQPHQVIQLNSNILSLHCTGRQRRTQWSDIQCKIIKVLEQVLDPVAVPHVLLRLAPQVVMTGGLPGVIIAALLDEDPASLAAHAAQEGLHIEVAASGPAARHYDRHQQEEPACQHFCSHTWAALCFLQQYYFQYCIAGSMPYLAGLTIFYQSKLRMRSRQEALDPLLKRVSVKINKSPEEIEPFFHILKNNWYDTEESLQSLAPSDYQRMKIPMRVAQAITEQLRNRAPSSPEPLEKLAQNTGKLVLNQQTMVRLTDALALGLMKSLDQNRYQVRSILEIIFKIVSNIVKEPYEMKFRTLRKSNNLIQKNIVLQPACLEFVRCIGFQGDSQTLQLTKFDVPQLVFLEECLNEKIIQLGGASLQQVPPKKQQSMFLNNTKFPQSQSEVREQFSEEKLSEMKYVNALDKLIEFRNRIMSQPPQERRVRIYHKRFEQKNVSMQQVSFDEEFQRSDDQAVLSYWKQIVANNNRAQKFQSKRKMQFDFLIKQKIYRETLIKVKLPNELVIEAYFGPMERLQAVFKLVASIVIGDLYMFTAPPRKVMDKKQMGKTLIELEAVPTGSFYLAATDNAYYITQPYASTIRT